MDEIGSNALTVIKLFRQGASEFWPEHRTWMLKWSISAVPVRPFVAML